MGMKAQLVAVSPGLPRDDLIAHPIGSVQASRQAAESVLPGLVGEQVRDGSLAEDCYPQSQVYAGTFGDTWIVASDHDSLLGWEPPDDDRDRNAIRVFLHSVVTMAGFTYWGSDGSHREFVGSWEEGAPVNDGDELPFEQSFWAGQQDPDGEARELHGSEMPFNPMDLGEEALREFFGFVGEGEPHPTDLDGFDIVLHGFNLVSAAEPAEVAAPAPRSRGVMSRLFGRNRPAYHLDPASD